MKRALAPLLALVLLGAALWAAPARAADPSCEPAEPSFGLCGFGIDFQPQPGEAHLPAGSHPADFELDLGLNVKEIEEGLEGDPETIPAGEVKDLRLLSPPGLVGRPTAVPRCSGADFAVVTSFVETHEPGCSPASAVGTITVELQNFGETFTYPIYNLEPTPGTVAMIGFMAGGLVPVTIDLRLSPDPPYNVIAESTNTPQPRRFYAVETHLWGVPADPVHDAERGSCLEDGGLCGVSLPEEPFLTLPTRCDAPLEMNAEASSWQEPGSWVKAPTALTHDEAEPPAPLAPSGCAGLEFAPGISAAPTSRAASSPTGLDFSLDVDDPSLTNPVGRAASTIRKVEVTLPEGMSANPSLADGLAVCGEADLAKETATSQPGEGCPQASKIGTVQVESPLVDEDVDGSLYIAEPYQNPFGSLLAMYLVLKNPQLGISVTQPLRIEPDPVTGQLTTVAEELPQLPFSHFKLHFKEGTRSPLATPRTCGSHEVKAVLTPWAGGSPVTSTSTSTFEILTGPDNGPCPAGGLPPFRPGLIAGTLNNRAGSFSPFNLRLHRSDSEQEITHFSIKLPPGITGKLAGVPYCPDQAIEAAKARTGPHGGAEEIAAPSCPAASEIGRTLAGAGVGPALAYAPGKVYLSGPYHGSPLSLVAITAGVVGPFDIGTVVIREALQINPETAEVFIDATGSDPIPHIIRGIPVHLRDIRAYVDKPNFVLNPTSCARTSTASTVLGSGLDFVSEADDNPLTVTSPFQAADCASLGFKPKLALKLTGATRRGGNPALRATLIPRPGDANSRSISVQLPHSEFLDQAHIRTVCTRVQFNAGTGNGAACPAGSVYGHARAFTPLLSEPLEGPVFLRSSEHPLPDLVLAMHGPIDFNAVGRVDSVGGGIRNTFDFVPDAPVSKVVVDFEGGKKGLLENSTNLCKSKNRAIAKFTGHNGKAFNAKPVLKVKCKKGNKAKRQHKERDK